jgi:hypothetical protein
MLPEAPIRRTLEWSRDDNGDLVALNPYEGDLESADYATSYVVRRDQNLGYVVLGEFAGVFTPIGTFADVEEACDAAQRDADERAAPDD